MFFKKAKAVNAKDYVLGIMADDYRQYRIESSDNDSKSFAKLIFNLIIQESYKHLKDDTFISPDVIFDMISKQIDNVSSFPTEKFDFDSINLASISTVKLPNLLLGKRINKEANRLAKGLDEVTNYGEYDHYMLFYNDDDQIFSLEDNEERNLALVFYYFIDGCRKYKLKPHHMLRAIKEQAYKLRETLLFKSKTNSPLLFYKLGSGDRYDYCRDVSEFEKDQKIKSAMLKLAKQDVGPFGE